MLLFEFADGHLVPARVGTPADIDPLVLSAVRDQVLAIIGRPLFPVQWDAAAGSHAAPGEPTRLIAMDAAGQVVSVEVLAALDSAGLVEALARSGQGAALGWLELAGMYPGGAEAFRQDWNAFRQAMPPRPVPGPRLYLVTGHVADDVRPALEALADSGVEVHEVSQRRLASGRVVVEVVEPHRGIVPTIGAFAALQAGYRPDLALTADEDIRRLLAAAPDAHTPDEAWDEDALEDASDVDAGLRAVAEACAGDTPLVWVRLRRGERHEAVLRSDGVVALPDGQTFADPSRAAAQVSGRQEVDGWSVWRLTDGGPTLAEARAELDRPRPRGRRRR